MQKVLFYSRIRIILLFMLAAGLCCPFTHLIYAQTEEKKKESEPEERVRMSRDAQKALYSAQEAMKLEKFVAARNFLVDYRATLTPEEQQLDDNLPVMYFHMLAATWTAEDNLEEARKIFKDGWDRYPNDEALMINYAITTYNTEHFKEAGPLFERIYATVEKKDSRYLQQAAAAYYQIENYKEAKRVLTQMFALPEKAKPEWYQMIIQVCMELNQMKEAENYVLQYLSEDPMKSEYWILYAQMRLDQEDYRGGASALEIAYHIKQPTRITRYEELADLYNYLNAPLKAAKSLEIALREKKSDEDQLTQKIVQIYTRAQRFDIALSYLDKMIAQNPTEKLYFEKARLLYDIRRMDEAIDALDECLKLNRKMGDALILKGFAAWYLKDWDKARDAFNAASDIKSVRLQADDALAVLDDLESAKHIGAAY